MARKSLEFSDTFNESTNVPETNNVPEDAIQDLDLSAIRKKRFRIDGDNNRILELNTSDVNILSRMREAYPKLQSLSERAKTDWPEAKDSEEDTGIESDLSGRTVDFLKDLDSEMRDLVDYIFDSNVSEVCAPTGSMLDPFEGRFRFDHIIDVLSGLYEDNMDKEIKKMTKNVSKHTSKYIK